MKGYQVIIINTLATYMARRTLRLSVGHARYNYCYGVNTNTVNEHRLVNVATLLLHR